MAESNSVNSLFSSIINIQISTHYRHREKEKFPFLDVLVSKKADVPSSVQKTCATHTDRYLHVKSHHPAQKQSAINSFVHRAFIISDKEHLQTEFNHLKTALQKNGHDKKDIIKTINKHANKTTDSDTQSDERILSIPFSHMLKEQEIGLAEY